MDDYLLSVTEVSVRLKTNRNFVYELINSKLLSAIKLGSLKIRNSEVNRFLKEYDGKDLTDLSNIKELVKG
jgi:excisionase family DNA binding protein